MSEVARDGPAIWERIRRRVDVHLGEIEVFGHRLLERDLTPDEAESASTTAGSLARELGLLQLPSPARLARHLTTVFDEGLNEPGTAVHVAATCDDIRTLVDSAIAQQYATSSARGDLVVVGPETARFDAICWVAASRGFAISVGLEHHDADWEPVGAVVAVEGPTTAADQATLQAIAESWRVPTMVLTDTFDSTDLRRLARRATVMLPFDTPPATVTDEMIRAVAAIELKPTALLCGLGVDAATRFESHGFEVRPVESPDDLLEGRVPSASVVVFGPAVPATLVADLARVFRTSPHTKNVPMLWQHTGTSRPHTLGAAREGVTAVESLDDSVISAVHAQLRSMDRDLALDENETGAVLSWAAAQVLLDRSLVAAHRSSTSVAVASINVGDAIASDALHDVIEAFAREFRRGDIVCRREDRNLVVALQGVSRRVAINRMSELFERFSLDEGSGRAGVAVFPNDGRSAIELTTAADSAIAVSAEHDGPRVAAATWRPEGSASADLMIVDPDPVLTAVLTAAFEERGVHVECSHDGREALHLLSGEGQRRLPRLVMVDLDMPGMDGMALVRRLSGRGILAQTSVLLMTARTTEADIRLALELGVSDIIRKPFSTTLVLHRAARLLEDR